MDPDFGQGAFWLAAAVTVAAAFVKGAVGFGMPMVMVSGLGSFLPAKVALATLIVPTLVTNVAQAFRQGWRPALRSVVCYWRLIVTIVLFIAASAQLVTVIPQAVLFGLLGVPILAFAVTQLAGWQIGIDASRPERAELAVGAVGGFYGGLSGVWGPPVIAYLVARGTEKTESVRVQGVVYLIGSIMLLGAHLQSGVLNDATLPLSLVMLVPSALGLLAGFVIQDRLDQALFRRVTLVVLAVSGLNLIRRAFVV